MTPSSEEVIRKGRRPCRAGGDGGEAELVCSVENTNVAGQRGPARDLGVSTSRISPTSTVRVLAQMARSSGRSQPDALVDADC